MNIQFEKFAEELKQARESAGISPEQIALKIKIDLSFLHRMEKGDFSFLPEIYIKAFLREYANLVGLNSQNILKKFQLAKDGKLLESVSDVQLDFDKKPESEQKEVKKIVVDSPATEVYEEYSRASSKNKLYYLAGFSIVIVLGIIYFVFIKSDSETIISERPVEESIQESKKRFEEENFLTQNNINDSLMVSFKAIDSSWLQIIFDDKITQEYYLHKDNQLNLNAKESFNLLIGNARGLEIIFNNNRVMFPEKVKNVARVRLDKNGVKHLENISASKTIQ